MFGHPAGSSSSPKRHDGPCPGFLGHCNACHVVSALHLLERAWRLERNGAVKSILQPAVDDWRSDHCKCPYCLIRAMTGGSPA
jgi:hypothetical protein